MAALQPPDAPAPVRAAVLGRYAGVVEVLADLLRAGGIDVTATWAANRDGSPLPLPPSGVVPVVPFGPGDDTLPRLRDAGLHTTVVGVVWHPDDELGPPPGPLSVVRAGSITATLAATVRLTAAEA